MGGWLFSPGWFCKVELCIKKWALEVYFGTLRVWANLLGRIGEGVTLKRKDGEALGVGRGAGALRWIVFWGKHQCRLCTLACPGTLQGSAGLAQGLHSLSNS